MSRHRLVPSALLGLVAALLASAAGAQTAAVLQSPPQNVVHLSAEASREVTQDLLSITLAAVREGGEAAAVQGQLRQALDAALAEARKAARPGQIEVRTGAFTMAPRYASPKPGQAPAVSGWQGRAELVLEGADIAGISALAGRLGGLAVSRVGFGLSRAARDQAEAEVAAQAIARFKARATAYAQQFGFGGHSLREVTVGSAETGGGPVPMLRARALAAPAMADESQPVEAGKATVSVTVSGSIQLSPR